MGVASLVSLSGRGVNVFVRASGSGGLGGDLIGKQVLGDDGKGVEDFGFEKLVSMLQIVDLEFHILDDFFVLGLNFSYS